MAVSARRVCLAGVALLGVGAIAATPVAPPLQALTLRTVAVPAGDMAQLPAWIAEAAAGLDDRSPVVAAPPRPRITPPLPSPGAVVRDSAGSAVPPNASITLAAGPPEGASVPAAAALPDSTEVADGLARALQDPTELAAVMATAAIDVRTLIHQAVTSVVGVVTDLASDALGDLRVPRAVVNNFLPLVAAVVNIPVSVAAQFMTSAELVIEALATLDPAAVADAFNQGVADVQGAANDAVGGVVTAWDTLRSDVTTGLRPAATSDATSVPSRRWAAPAPASGSAVAERVNAAEAAAVGADDLPSVTETADRTSARPGVHPKAPKVAGAAKSDSTSVATSRRTHTSK